MKVRPSRVLSLFRMGECFYSGSYGSFHSMKVVVILYIDEKINAAPLACFVDRIDHCLPIMVAQSFKEAE